MKTTHPKNSRNRLDRKENRPPRAGRPKKDGERAPYRSSRSKRDEEEKPFRSPRPDRSEERRERKPSRVKDADKPVRKRAGLTRKDAKPLRKDAKPLRKDAKPLRKDTKPAPKAPKPVKEEVRLNRFIANSGICSRREADTYITAGLVSVNGEVVTELGVKVKPDDEVRFNGERLKGERKVYIVMNKPKDYVTTTADPHAGNMVTDLISSQRCPQRVFPVGRLDRDTTGVLLFTNDGDFAERLSHPSHNQKKIYHVFLGRKLRPQDLRKLVDGIALDDGMAHADLAFYVGSDHTEVGLEIHSGRNRVVRRMFERMGYKIKKLDRVSFAGISKQSLKRGQWRYLNDHEVAMLRMSTHL